MKHPIGTSRNGIEVFVDLIGSAAAKNISQQPQLATLLKDALGKTTLRSTEHIVEHDMGRPVGYHYIVDTTDEDVIFYAQALKDSFFTRFVKGRKPDSTARVSFFVQKQDDGTYQLHDAWIGPAHPPHPGSERETNESKTFWQSHAHIFSGNAIQTRSVTKACPY